MRALMLEQFRQRIKLKTRREGHATGILA